MSENIETTLYEVLTALQAALPNASVPEGENPTLYLLGRLIGQRDVARASRAPQSELLERVQQDREVLRVLLDEAWAALPDSVSGDAAPEGTTLAQRITALTMERDRNFEGWRNCHAKHAPSS